jgi:3-oxoacyl-[acyl-carrier-protein] synthase-3
MNLTVIGTGSSTPKCVKTNFQLSEILDTTDEWITSRTGIKERHILTDETVAQIASEAAVAALNDADVTADELDYIICATLRGDYITPSLACEVQRIIGASCPAFDLNAACSGFVYSLDVAAALFAAKKAKKILIVAAESLSKLVDWKDRSTCVLFGDGAGAVVLSDSDNLLAIKLTAKGAAESLYIPSTDRSSPFNEQGEIESYINMDGGEIYKFAVTAITNELDSIIDAAGLSANDVDYVLLHQANVRIIDAAANRLNISREKYLVNISKYGNTSAASIPILLDEVNRDGKFKKGDLLALCAFGGGLTTGTCILRWDK